MSIYNIFILFVIFSGAGVHGRILFKNVTQITYPSLRCNANNSSLCANHTKTSINSTISKPVILNNDQTDISSLNRAGNVIIKKQKLEGRIVGGFPAGPGQFPHQVSIHHQSSKSLICGGSIIGSRTILTAAQCFYSDGKKLTPENIYVNAGVVNLKQRNEYQVDKIKIHEKYDKKKNDYDIAVIILSEELVSNTNQRIIVNEIPLSESTPPEKTNCVVSGFGSESFETDKHPDYLKFVNVTIRYKKQCVHNYAEKGVNITDSMICATRQEGNGDACVRDAGGPLVCGHGLVGIVSFGNGCAVYAYPGIYTDVSEYSDWIDKNKSGASSKTISGTIMTLCALVMYLYSYDK